MTVNVAKFEESSEILIEDGTVTPADGVTITYASVIRIGSLVAVHIEFGAPVDGTAATLDEEYRPGDTVHALDGSVVHADGSVAPDGMYVDIVYAAAQASP
jgi:hypothetical protein